MDDYINLRLPRPQAVALLEATDGDALGPLVGARQTLREALGTEVVARRVAQTRTQDPRSLAGSAAEIPPATEFFTPGP